MELMHSSPPGREVNWSLSSHQCVLRASPPTAAPIPTSGCPEIQREGSGENTDEMEV